MIKKEIKHEKTVGELFGALLFLIVSIPATAALQGITIQKLWQWYVVPTFNLPQLTIMVAWGVALTISAIRLKLPLKVDSRPNIDAYTYIIGVWAALGFLLLMGWVGTFFL